MSHESRPIRIAVLTVSDRCSAGKAVDTSGPGLASLAKGALRGEVAATACVPDEVAAIQGAIKQWVEVRPAIDLILTTGGTGLAPRDVTPEAVTPLIQRPWAGLMELARAKSAAKTVRAFLSRGVAGVAGQSLIVTLPGSPRGSSEQFEAIMELLPHAIETLRGEVQDDGRPGAVETTGRVVRHGA